MQRNKDFFKHSRASKESQLLGGPCLLPDTEEMKMLRSGKKWEALGERLQSELRYREAAEAYTMELREKGESYRILRKRATCYITSLQVKQAIMDLERCLILGGDEGDLFYRLGLCFYFQGFYQRAMEYFQKCYPFCDEEMGVAVIYWEFLSACHSKQASVLKESWHPNMEVGHHVAYDCVMQVVCGMKAWEEVYEGLSIEKDDLTFSIVAYGIWVYLRDRGDEKIFGSLYKQILKRDGFWFSYAYLAAWNEQRLCPFHMCIS